MAVAPEAGALVVRRWRVADCAPSLTKPLNPRGAPPANERGFETEPNVRSGQVCTSYVGSLQRVGRRLRATLNLKKVGYRGEVSSDEPLDIHLISRFQFGALLR
jgi:hypothetical protein